MRAGAAVNDIGAGPVGPGGDSRGARASVEDKMEVRCGLQVRAALEHQMSGAGLATGIVRAGHVGDHARDRDAVSGVGREGAGLVALQEDAAPVSRSRKGAVRTHGASGDAVVLLAAGAGENERSALLHEDRAAGAEAAAACIEIAVTGAETTVSYGSVTAGTAATAKAAG